MRARQTDKYFIDRKKVNPDLFVIEIEICTCIYNIVNLLNHMTSDLNLDSVLDGRMQLFNRLITPALSLHIFYCLIDCNR